MSISLPSTPAKFFMLFVPKLNIKIPPENAADER
jgi:hypothetical protein